MKNKKIALCALLAVHIALPLSLTETAKNSLEIIKKSAHTFNEKRKQYISNKSIAQTACIGLLATHGYLLGKNEDALNAFLEKHSQAINMLLALEGVGILGVEACLMFINSNIAAYYRIKHLAHPKANTTESPTKKYIAQHPKRVINKFENDIANTNLKHLPQELIQLEEQENKQGHYTFVHGEPTHMHAYQHWFTKLCEVKYNTPLNNYIFTRFKHTQNEDIIAKHTIKRKQLKQNGNRKMVFMAHNLYSNRAGACAGDYYLHARQQWDYTTKIQDIFSSFGYQDIYNQFANELHALEKEYKELCPLGQLLMFSFSPKALKKCVYTCYPGGHKRSVKIKNPATDELQSTDNMVKIAQALKNNPDTIEDYESLEFCFIPTLDYGLNLQVAGKDVRVFNLTGVEPAKMEAYLQKEAVLTKKIQAAINTQKCVAIQKSNAPALA